MRLKPIDQQVVVIMGASSGIGRETAYRFAQRGARVVVSARSQAGLDSLVDQIQSVGGEATAIVADVTDLDQLRRVADTAVEMYGRLDTWVHAAAATIYATFEDTTPEEFRRILDVNLLGQIYGAKAALPHLRKQGGALIHISSVEALLSLPYQSAYAASKHGITGFLDALRLELKQEGVPISVTNILPASINTPLFNKGRSKLGVQPKGLPPFYEPEIVADAILYAAEHPTRHLFAGDAARIMAVTQTLSPQVMDKMLLQVGFQGQRTDRPLPENAPDNLFAPIDMYNRVHGDFGDQAMAVSPYNSLVQSVSGIQMAVAGLAIGAVFALMKRANGSRDDYDREPRYDRELTYDREPAYYESEYEYTYR